VGEEILNKGAWTSNWGESLHNQNQPRTGGRGELYKPLIWYPSTVVIKRRWVAGYAIWRDQTRATKKIFGSKPQEQRKYKTAIFKLLEIAENDLQELKANIWREKANRQEWSSVVKGAKNQWVRILSECKTILGKLKWSLRGLLVVTCLLTRVPSMYRHVVRYVSAKNSRSLFLKAKTIGVCS
jgi:hypothetical protein